MEQRGDSPVSRESSPLERLMSEVDYHIPPRRAWTLAWRGRERESAQAVLIECARCARREATTQDALALYKAAHAVLPLRGTPLLELADLLAENGPVPNEWCDVLVAALGEGNTPNRQHLLERLKEAAAREHDSGRAAWIRRCLARIIE